MIFRLFEYLAQKPVAGVFSWFTFWVLGSVPDPVTTTSSRDDFLFYAQCFSLCLGSIAAVFTIISISIKLIKRRK